MEITTKTTRAGFVIMNVESGSTKIEEDVTKDTALAYQLISAAFEIYRSAGKLDIEGVHEVYDMFLNNSERKEFLEIITKDIKN